LLFVIKTSSLIYIQTKNHTKNVPLKMRNQSQEERVRSHTSHVILNKNNIIKAILQSVQNYTKFFFTQ